MNRIRIKRVRTELANPWSWRCADRPGFPNMGCAWGYWSTWQAAWDEAAWHALVCHGVQL